MPTQNSKQHVIDTLSDLAETLRNKAKRQREAADKTEKELNTLLAQIKEMQ